MGTLTFDPARGRSMPHRQHLMTGYKSALYSGEGLILWLGLIILPACEPKIKCYG